MSAEEKGPKPFRTEENFGTDSCYGTFCHLLFWPCFGPFPVHGSVQYGKPLAGKVAFI